MRVSSTERRICTENCGTENEVSEPLCRSCARAAGASSVADNRWLVGNCSACRVITRLFAPSDYSWGDGRWPVSRLTFKVAGTVAAVVRTEAAVVEGGAK